MKMAISIALILGLIIASAISYGQDNKNSDLGWSEWTGLEWKKLTTFVFEPHQDITAYELAIILPFLLNGRYDVASFEKQVMSTPMKRHFRVQHEASKK